MLCTKAKYGGEKKRVVCPKCCNYHINWSGICFLCYCAPLPFMESMWGIAIMMSICGCSSRNPEAASTVKIVFHSLVVDTTQIALLHMLRMEVLRDACPVIICELSSQAMLGMVFLCLCWYLPLIGVDAINVRSSGHANERMSVGAGCWHQIGSEVW